MNGKGDVIAPEWDSVSSANAIVIHLSTIRSAPIVDTLKDDLGFVPVMRHYSNPAQELSSGGFRCGRTF